MVTKKVTIDIPQKGADPLSIDIATDPSSKKDSLWQISQMEATEFGEASIQIMEGCSYEYSITKGYSIKAPDKVIYPSALNISAGRIAPNTYVGTLTIDIINLKDNIECGTFQLEVVSEKTSYRDDYRQMLEDIAEKCTELIMQQNTAISQHFTPDYNRNPQILYQKFVFIKAILDTVEFNEAIHKILSAPVTNWAEAEVEKDIRGIKRINNKIIRQITRASSRINLPEQHGLINKLNSIPSKVKINYKRESTNIPENRFIKHALTHFLWFCNDFSTKIDNNSKHKKEVLRLEDKLNHLLNHSFFKELSTVTILPLNSPILQRKEGYREAFRIWLMFDLAAKLFWQGGDDIYAGGKKNVALLYEYWVFFKLTDVIVEVFKINPCNVNQLIEKTKDGLGLKIKQGTFFAIEGVYENKTRPLNLKFSYNRTFSGKKEYPSAGSWTSSLRPDYTLSIWPYGISEDNAEKEELIIHIHFDAKYKIDSIKNIFSDEEDNSIKEKTKNKNTYKRADLHKMHTYRDAIRRTVGAYILYPGEKAEMIRGFHEILPGIGAFSLRPSKNNNGLYELKNFLNEVVRHLLNRASQRERISLKTYSVYSGDHSLEVNELLPETHGSNRSLLPDETFVLVGFYKNDAHLNWIIDQRLYNTRIGDKKGSLHLSFKETSAKYLLLYTNQEKKTTKFFKLNERGPRIFSKKDLLNNHYPSKPSQPFYLVFEIEHELEKEFTDQIWDVTKLSNFNKNIPGLPFSASLSEVTRVLIKP